MDFQIGSRGHGGFVRFYPCGHGAVNMCLSVEGCELWQEIIFEYVPSRRMYINTRNVVYNGRKVGFNTVGVCMS